MGFLFINSENLKEKSRSLPLLHLKEEEKLSKDRVIKWKDIKDKINSDNIEDWKEAIIIADSILDDIYSRMGYKMDGLGKTEEH